MRVAICALTFHRPEGLQALLAGVGALERPLDASVEVVVIDNDPAASAESVAGAIDTGWPLHYVVEPRRGIAQARNRAVEVALALGADLVAFVDDDEVPEPDWLTELLRAHAATGAEVVTGPVLPVFDQPPPAWVVEGAFFDRPRYEDLAPMDYARTSNVLIAGALLRRPWPPFDERFALTGGEDTHFFLRVRLAGARLVWADRAVVRESVPPSRVSARWLLRRAYRNGNTRSLCLRDLRDSWPNRARRVGAAAAQIGQGLAVGATAIWRGRAGAVAGLARVAYGLGLLSGLVGHHYEEYRQIHGT